MSNNFVFNSKNKFKNNFFKSQRQLKVGEEIRHLISNALLRESFYEEHIKNNNITVTEVDVSADLKNAKVFVMPLGGKKKDDVLDSLNKVSGRIKKIISNNLSLRQTPKLIFKIDETFEYANKIHYILEKIKK
jgi:ribosome-binding factor A